jgi:hypothetical protein
MVKPLRGRVKALRAVKRGKTLHGRVNALRAKQQMKKRMFSIDINALTGKTPTLTRRVYMSIENTTHHPVL